MNNLKVYPRKSLALKAIAQAGTGILFHKFKSPKSFEFYVVKSYEEYIRLFEPIAFTPDALYCENINADRKPHFEVWDIDYTIPSECPEDKKEYLPTRLFHWFQALHLNASQWIISRWNHLPNQDQPAYFSKLTSPDWKLTTATDIQSNKISFHILNRNHVFTQQAEFKAFYNLMLEAFEKVASDEYIQQRVSYITDFPIGCIDRCISSIDRSLRHYGCVKPTQVKNQDRYLRLCEKDKTRWTDTLVCYTDHTRLKDHLCPFSFKELQQRLQQQRLQQQRLQQRLQHKTQTQQLKDNDNNELDKNKSDNKSIVVSDQADHRIFEQEQQEINLDFEQDVSEVKYNKVSTLLDIIGRDYCDEYSKWLSVSFALLNIFEGSDQGKQLFHTFSALSDKYNKQECDEHWSRLLKTRQENEQSLPGQRKIGFGSLYYFASQYDTFATQYLGKFPCDNRHNSNDTYTFAKIKMNFQPNEVVHTPQLNADFYPNVLSKCSYTPNQKVCLAIKSGCGTGKTYNLPSIFGDKRILIIVFRVSLGQEMMKNYLSHGFKYYRSQDVCVNQFDADEYPRLVVTIDSLHKVYGSYDMIIMDEFCSIAKHIFEGTVKDKIKTLRHFIAHINHAKLNVCLDANLNDDMLAQIFDKHLVYKVHNTYSKYENTVANFVFVKQKRREFFNQQIIQEIQAGKRVVICSNSASFIEKNKLFIQQHLPETTILSYTQKNNHEIDTTRWNTVQVLSYSPTITAGVSWNPEEPYYDCLYAYFINGEHTCDVDSCLQQLFRVRKLRENRMHIMISPDNLSTIYPLSYTDIKNDIIKNIQLLGGHLQGADWLQKDVITKELQMNKEFYLYQLYIKESNLSRVYFASYMHSLLTQYGMKTNVEMIDGETMVKELQPTTDLMKEIDEQLNKIELEELVQTEIINPDRFYALERKKVKTREEFLQYIKYQTYLTFNIPHNATFINESEQTLLLDASKSFYVFNNLKTLVTRCKTNTIVEQIEYCKQRHIEQYNMNLDRVLQSHVDYLEGNKTIEEQLKALRLSTNPDTAITKMLASSGYLKQYYTLRAIESIGLASISDASIVENPFMSNKSNTKCKTSKLAKSKNEHMIQNPYEKVSKYLNDNQEELSLLFPSSFQFDKVKQKTLKGYARFINMMLSIFGLKFHITGATRNQQYKLDFILDFNMFANIKKRAQEPKSSGNKKTKK